MIRTIIKATSILGKKQKRFLGVLVFLMIIGAMLETLSVSLILPLISVAMKPEVIFTNTYVRWVSKLFHITDAITFIECMIVALIIMFVLKNLYLFFEYWLQTRFVCDSRYKIQKELVRTFISRPYEYFVNASTSEIIRVIFSDVGGAFQVINSLLSLLTEVIVATALILTIVVISPLMAVLLTFILGMIGFLFIKVVKPISRKAGEEWQINYALANKWILQAINGIKEIKVYGRENFFQDKYNGYAKRSVSAEKKDSLLSNAPRMLLETVCVGGILLILLLLIIIGNDITSLIPELSALALAAVRLLPSANRINTSLSKIAFHSAAVDKMIDNLQAKDSWCNVIESSPKEDGAAKKITLNKECALSHVTYHYANSEKLILENADMVIPVGKSVGIVGASGAGKTTAVDILLGVLYPQSGKVVSDGSDISCDYKQWNAHIGYIPQTIFMLDDSVRANVAFGQEQVDDSKVWEALDEAQLGDLIREMPEGLDTNIGERGLKLSGGQRQRIGIARALYLNPSLLVLDEATSALDNETELAIMEAIDNLRGKKTMIIIAHRLQTIQNCDIIYKVEKGKIVRKE